MKIWLGPLVMLMLSACSREKLPDALMVKDVWVRMAPVSGNPGAGYFTLQGGSQANRLIEMTSPRAGSIELHESMAVDHSAGHSAMTMKKIAAVEIPAGGTVQFAPGGKHAMLFKIDPAVRPGTTIPLTFRFSSGSEYTLDAKVIAAGDDAPTGHADH